MCGRVVCEYCTGSRLSNNPSLPACGHGFALVASEPFVSAVAVASEPVASEPVASAGAAASVPFASVPVASEPVALCVSKSYGKSQTLR